MASLYIKEIDEEVEIWLSKKWGELIWEEVFYNKVENIIIADEVRKNNDKIMAEVNKEKLEILMDYQD